jgi:hypothetical protein
MQESSRCGDSQHALLTSYTIGMDSQPHLQHHYQRQSVPRRSGHLQGTSYSLLFILTLFCEHCMHMWPCQCTHNQCPDVQAAGQGISHSLLCTPVFCEHCMHMWQVVPCYLVALVYTHVMEGTTVEMVSMLHRAALPSAWTQPCSIAPTRVHRGSLGYGLGGHTAVYSSAWTQCLSSAALGPTGIGWVRGLGGHTAA